MPDTPCLAEKSVPAKCVRDVLLYKKFGTVLDIGTGDGRNAIFLAQKGFTVTAIDSNPEKIRFLKSLADKGGLPVTATVQDIQNIGDVPIFDVVMAINVLHFLNADAIASAIAAIQNHTCANGLNVISVHTDKNPPGSRPHLFRGGELRGYYENWNILLYEEILGKAFLDKQGDLVRKYRATLIAQKP